MSPVFSVFPVQLTAQWYASIRESPRVFIAVMGSSAARMTRASAGKASAPCFNDYTNILVQKRPKMGPDASLLNAQHIHVGVGLASVSSRTLFKILDGVHLKRAIESGCHKLG